MDVEKTTKFTLFFTVSALDISMADYDSVVVRALQNKLNGYGNQFSIQSTYVHLKCIILDTTWVGNKFGSFEKVKLEIDVIEALDEEDATKFKTKEELQEILEKELAYTEYLYNPAYCEEGYISIAFVELL